MNLINADKLSVGSAPYERGAEGRKIQLNHWNFDFASRAPMPDPHLTQSHCHHTMQKCHHTMMSKMVQTLCRIPFIVTDSDGMCVHTAHQYFALYLHCISVFVCNCICIHCCQCFAFVSSTVFVSWCVRSTSALLCAFSIQVGMCIHIPPVLCVCICKCIFFEYCLREATCIRIRAGKV